MNPISRAAGAVTHPVRSVGAVAGTAVGLAMTGARTAAHLAGWVVERTFGQAATQPSPWRDTTDRPATAPVDGLLGVRVPDPAPDAEAPLTTAPVTRTATKKAATKAPAAKAPAKKAPATKAPAKQAPATKAPAKQAPAKQAPAKKAPAKKAPSRQAAVVAPALGLSEDEVLEVLDDAAGPDEG